MTVYSYHAMYSFQNESTLYICLNVKELLARNRHHIWSLSDCNGTRTHNYLVPKQTLNHLAILANGSLANWLSVHLQTKRLWVQVLLQSLQQYDVFLFHVLGSPTNGLESLESESFNLWN